MKKINTDDGVLIERFQRGHQEAFDQLVQRYQEQAYRYAYRLTRNADEAADVVAEAFVRVYKSLNRFKGDSSFSTWLYRIETNCFLDMKKRPANRSSVAIDELPTESGENWLTQIPDGSDSAQDIIEKRERLTAIQNGMKSLSKTQQAILLMFHGESMSYEEIAEATQVPIGTVKSRINRARFSLQKALKPKRNLFLPANTKRRDFANA